MAKINVKQQIIIVTIIIGAISAIIAIAIIIPAIKEILSLQKNINETQEFLEQEYQKTQKIKRSIHNLESTIKETQKYKNIIVKEDDELQIITQLESLAYDNKIEQNIKVQKINPREIKDLKQKANLPALLQNKSYYSFSFSNNGNFKNHVQYIKSLEKLPYYFNIESMQWQKNESKKTIELRFNAKLYITE